MGIQHEGHPVTSILSSENPVTRCQVTSPRMESRLPTRTDHNMSSSNCKPKQSSRRYSGQSTTSLGARSASSVENSTRSAIPRPSGIPRATNTALSTKPPATATPQPHIRTSSTFSKPKPSPVHDQNIRIAHKQSPRTMHTAQIKQALKRRDDGFMQRNTDLADHDPELEGQFDHRQSRSQPRVLTTNLPPKLIPELQALAHTTRQPIPLSSSVSTISSPSSQWTGSQSPWSASTNTTTSISWSSTSPSILQASRSPVNSKRSYTVPIPSMNRSRLPGLPVLPETTSGSNSSSKTNLRKEAVTPTKKSKRSPAPTPPPRSSSVKSTRSRSNSKDEDQRPRTSSEMPPPLPTRSDQRPTVHMESQQPDSGPQSPRKIATYHYDLQNALNRGIQGDHDVETQHQLSGLDYKRNGSAVSEINPRTLWESAPIESTSSSQLESSTNQSARSRLAKFSKIALFTRSPKVPTQTDEIKPQPRKLQRKGPAAGTGHEGYGKYGRKPKTSKEIGGSGTDSESSLRSTRTKSIYNTPRKVSSSSSRHNRNSQSDLDDFASTRMNPVAMVGGSQQASGFSGTALDNTNRSIQTQVRGQSPSIHDGYMQLVHSPDESLRQFPPTSPESRLKASPSPISQPTAMPGGLETYRLSEATRPGTSPSNLPYANNWNVSQSSFAPSYVTSTDAGSDVYHSEANTNDKQRKKIRRSKWNIFRKRDAGSASAAASDNPHQSRESDELAVTVSQVPIARPFPYYAMLESENEPNNFDELHDDFINENQVVEADDEEEFGSPDGARDPNTRERIESVLLPSAPQFKRELSRSRKSKRPALRILDPAEYVPQSAQIDREHRQPRLPQVGRIPKVVPTSHIVTPNRKSFSRPFNLSEQTSLSDLSHEVPKVLEPWPVFARVDRNRTNDDRTVCGDDFATDLRQGHSTVLEPVKWYDRQSVTSSSSGGIISIMGPPLIPAQYSPDVSKRMTVAEEDVWNEYDDLLDHVTTDARWRKSTVRETNDTRITSGEWQAGRIPSTKQSAPSLVALAKGLTIDTTIAEVPILLAAPEMLQDAHAQDEVRLRRSRIISALHNSMDPSSPFSIGDYLLDHGGWSRNSDHRSGLHGNASDGRAPSPRSFAPTIALPAVPESRHYDRTSQMNEVQRIKNPAKHSELSYASLMVSRWLSFGQVLFSPAHDELQKQSEKQVLVVDGLGNDDWSIYCAVTYQSEHAYVYDLKETGNHHRGDLQKTDSVPANFRRREIPSFSGNFNFPDNFFTVVVFRFPPVMAESKLKHIVSECRRVLAPGGHLELMLLDLDIVNMGVLTRRAMRDLKTKVTLSDPEVSLRPLIDNVQNVLGDKGFTKFSRCVVGVPVVGSPPSSTDSPVSSRSSGGSEQASFSPSAGPRPFDSIAPKNHAGFSLHDLVADHSDGADAKISKLVSRTARNWWQRCFETAVISDGNLARSILANKQVLSECKSRASNFKLLIAYAQKPMKPAVEPKRRTMSEPYIATLAPS